MSDKVKKKHHYVWRHYLKPWSKNGQIWCNRKGKIFNTSLENIGQRRFFYKAEKLNKIEENIINAIILSRPDTSQELAYKTFEMYQTSANGDDILQKNGIENFHTLVENTSAEVLEQLQCNDLSFLKNDLSKIHFCGFIGFQYMRTNRTNVKMVEGLKMATEAFPEYLGKFNPEKVSKVIALILSDAIGNWLYSEGSFQILENHTECEFITGDQPVYNLAGSNSSAFSPPTDFELYYPITPKIALHISKNQTTDLILSKTEVEKYNDFIRKSSFEQIYSSTENNCK